jgi:hypothetical protein
MGGANTRQNLGVVAIQPRNRVERPISRPARRAARAIRIGTPFKSRIDILKNVLQAQGTLTTTLDGKAYSAPASGT